MYVEVLQRRRGHGDQVEGGADNQLVKRKRDCNCRISVCGWGWSLSWLVSFYCYISLSPKEDSTSESAVRCYLNFGPTLLFPKTRITTPSVMK